MLFTRKWGTYCTPILPMFPYGNINVRIPISILPFIFSTIFFTSGSALIRYNYYVKNWPVSTHVYTSRGQNVCIANVGEI